MLIILEGSDGAGKSTLARYLAEKLDADVTSHGPYLGETSIFHRYLDPMLKMYGGHGHHIFDRSWLSEQIYGPVMRDADRIGASRRILDRVAMGLPAAVILCISPWKTVKETFTRRAMSEYPRNLVVLEKIWTLYRKLNTSVPILVYDYTKDSPEKLLTDVTYLGYRYRNQGEGIGCWNPGRVSLLVGEKQSVKGQPPSWTFVNDIGSSIWLAERLEELYIGENELYWANALAQDGSQRDLRWAKALAPQRVIALGQNADLVLTAQQVEHITIEHPQYWKRFRFTEPWANLKAAFALKGDHDLTRPLHA